MSKIQCAKCKKEFEGDSQCYFEGSESLRFCSMQCLTSSTFTMDSNNNLIVCDDSFIKVPGLGTVHVVACGEGGKSPTIEKTLSDRKSRLITDIEKERVDNEKTKAQLDRAVKLLREYRWEPHVSERVCVCCGMPNGKCDPVDCELKQFFLLEEYSSE